MFSRIPGLCPLEASSTPHVTAKNVSRDCQVAPGGQNQPSWEPLLLNLTILMSLADSLCKCLFKYAIFFSEWILKIEVLLCRVWLFGWWNLYADSVPSAWCILETQGHWYRDTACHIFTQMGIFRNMLQLDGYVACLFFLCPFQTV